MDAHLRVDVLEMAAHGIAGDDQPLPDISRMMVPITEPPYYMLFQLYIRCIINNLDSNVG